MRGKNIIFINGRQYDALTGLPMDTKTNASTVEPKPVMTAVEPAIERHPVKHHQTKKQHSTTLKREFVAKPHATVTPKTASKPKPVIAKSDKISKFAPHPVSSPKPDITRQVAHAKPYSPVKVTAPAVATKPKTSKELKDYLIEAQMASAQPNTKKPKAAKKRLKSSSLVAASLAVMILGGYLSYINMPNVSVRVAAAQSGVNAEYPNYIPSGYRFDGPVAYSDGQVHLSFAANGGKLQYSITQQKSQWDSQALLDNYVASKSRDYSINDSGGLTIYTYDNGAAWVNRGVLYTIDGDAPLRTDQILRIAQSM